MACDSQVINTRETLRPLRLKQEKTENGKIFSSPATANYALTMMYWHIGERINREVLGNKRAEYGKQIVASVARQLRDEYGSKGFDEKNIRRMMKFAKLFPDEQIVASAMRQLSWTHILDEEE